MQFKVGDVVELKTSSPYMTVIALGNDDDIYVAWFNQEGGKFELARNHFPPEALKPVKERDRA